MSDLVIGELLDDHKATLTTMGQALQEGQEDAFIAQTAGLLGKLATGSSLLGSLARGAVARAFGRSANDILREQIADWQDELDERALVARIGEAIEVLLGQALIQVIRSQQAIKDDTLAALGGLRADMADFRAQMADALAAAGSASEQVVEQDLVDGGATGVRIRQDVGKRLVIRQRVVRGKGTTGVVIG